MAEPVRLRLSRAKGFDLQAWSRETNGLAAVNVARPSRWGNPFVALPATGPQPTEAGLSARGYIAVPTIEAAVACYAEMMAADAEPGQRAFELRARLPELRGHNLACWCALDAPCHADVLLRLASPDQKDTAHG